MFSNLLRGCPSELPPPAGTKLGPRFWLLRRLGRGAEDPLCGRFVDMIEEDLTSLVWQAGKTSAPQFLFSRLVYINYEL